MVPLSKVYDAFLVKILDDEWGNWKDDAGVLDKEAIKADWRGLLEGAIPYFKFPRVSLEIDGDFFVDNNVSNAEIQLLATYMKCQWLNRTILTWENVKPLYVERDFSQANLLDKLNQLLEREEKNAEKLEGDYYRSIKGKPFKYSSLATKVDE